MSESRFVMVVDDNAADLTLARMAIAESEIVDSVVTASDGMEALQMLQECWRSGCMPSVVFLDLFMPGADGFDFLDALPAEWSVNVVVVTGSSSDPLRMRALAYTSVIEYVEKPILANDATRIIQRLIEKSAA